MDYINFGCIITLAQIVPYQGLVKVSVKLKL